MTEGEASLEEGLAEGGEKPPGGAGEDEVILPQLPPYRGYSKLRTRN